MKLKAEMVAAACEGLINQAVGMADDADEKCFVENRMRDATPAAARASLRISAQPVTNAVIFGVNENASPLQR